MDKYIGFDIDSKKTIACVVQKGQKDKYTTLRTDIEQMKKFLKKQRRPGEELHLTFEISGEAGYRYDALANLVILRQYINKFPSMVPCCDLDGDCVLTPADKYNF